jgi:hypothetical protein
LRQIRRTRDRRLEGSSGARMAAAGLPRQEGASAAVPIQTKHRDVLLARIERERACFILRRDPERSAGGLPREAASARLRPGAGSPQRRDRAPPMRPARE